jgi:cadmium resistance protein CadD (predicted permease)
MTNFFIDAIAAFFSTTLDDLMALMYLFVNHSHEDKQGSVHMKIIIGQFLGFTTIVLISLLGILLGAVVPDDYIDLIGFIPLCIGTYKLVTGAYEDCMNQDVSSAENESTPILAAADNSSIRESTGAMDDKSDISDVLDVSDRLNSSESSPRSVSSRPSLVRHASITAKKAEPSVSTMEQVLAQVLDPLVLESTMFALLCGSDNIVIYMTLFAAEDVANVAYIIIIFYVLLLINVCLALLIITVSQHLISSTSPPYLIIMLLRVASTGHLCLRTLCQVRDWSAVVGPRHRHLIRECHLAIIIAIAFSSEKGFSTTRAIDKSVAMTS